MIHYPDEGVSPIPTLRPLLTNVKVSIFMRTPVHRYIPLTRVAPSTAQSLSHRARSKYAHYARPRNILLGPQRSFKLCIIPLRWKASGVSGRTGTISRGVCFLTSCPGQVIVLFSGLRAGVPESPSWLGTHALLAHQKTGLISIVAMTLNF